MLNQFWLDNELSVKLPRGRCGQWTEMKIQMARLQKSFDETGKFNVL